MTPYTINPLAGIGLVVGIWLVCIVALGAVVVLVGGI